MTISETTLKTPVMRINNNGWTKWAICVLSLICLAFLFDGLILRQFRLDFHYDIQLVDIIGVLVTIVLALYLAHVVEANRERKKANSELLISIIQGLLSDIDSLSNQLYDAHLSYARLVSFSKQVLTKIQSITGVLQSIGIEDAKISDQITTITGKIRYLRPILTGIKGKEEAHEDYMVVEDSYVTEIADKRIARIQSNLSDLRKQLYPLWLSITALDKA